MWFITRVAALIFMILMVLTLLLGTIITPIVALVFRDINIVTSYKDFYGTVAECYAAALCVLWQGKKACL